MAFKQPHVPEYRGESMEAYIRKLTLFLKDFCQEAWTQSRVQKKEIDALEQRMQAMRMEDGKAD